MPSASLPSTSSELISHLQLLYPACSQCHWQRALCRKITETGDGYGWQSCPSPGLTHSPMPSSLTLLVCSCSQLGSPAPHTAVVGLSLPNWGVPWMCCWGHHVPVMLKVFWVSPLCPNWVWVCLCWRHSLGFSMGFLPAPGPSLCCQPSGWLGLAGWEVFRHDERSQDIIFCIFRYIFRPGTSNIYKPDSGVWNLQEHPWWGGVPNFNVLFPFSWGIFRWHQFHVMGVKQRPLDLTRRYFSAWQKFFNWKIWGFSDLFCFVFFNRKNDISSNMKSFLYPLFFFFSVLIRKYKLYIILSHVGPNCIFFPPHPLSKSPGWAAFPGSGSPSTQAEQHRHHMHTASAQFLECFLCRKLLMDLSWLSGQDSFLTLPGLLPGPKWSSPLLASSWQSLLFSFFYFFTISFFYILSYKADWP